MSVGRQLPAVLGPLCSFTVVLDEEAEVTQRHRVGCGLETLGPEPSCFPMGAGYSGRLYPSLGFKDS